MVDFTLPFPSLLVPPVALGILAGIIVRRKENEKHSYNVNSQKQEVKGRDTGMHLEVTDEKKLPKLWNSYFCHTGKCHVCPSCEEQLHSALAPLSEPPQHGCAACQDWLSSQPQKPRSYSVPSVGDGDSQSPAGTSSPAMDVDVLRADGTGGAAPWRSEAEQPMDHQSDHICPTCESWLRAHTGQGDSRAVTPGEWQHKGINPGAEEGSPAPIPGRDSAPSATKGPEIKALTSPGLPQKQKN
nr:uncharacterized protein LOC113460002 isoform X2 [Zonotrichia albicollis]